MNLPAQTAYCSSCRVKHVIRPQSYAHLIDALDDFRQKHLRPTCNLGVATEGIDDFRDNSDVKEASQAEQSMTVTNLHSLASSATAGWTSNSVDNSSNLYLDAEIMIHIAAVNTAPASDKSIYVFAYGSTDAAIFTSTGTSGGTVGTEGTLTFPSISTLGQVMPLVGIIPYPVQNKAIDAGPFYISSAFARLPLTWGLAILNFSGMTFAASGNTVKYRGNYSTVT